MSQRYGLLLLQQLRPQQIPLGINYDDSIIQARNPGLPGNQYMNPISMWVAQPQDPKKKMMNQLHELEKQLLVYKNDEGDVVSVITNTNSEWSETIQNAYFFNNFIVFLHVTDCLSSFD
ncbi:hypothetical protein F3Y22_tig00112737pilonHSYRG00040 [Hibiscus syriacus]|uniref:Uncharacterized protein n=1 Tax=Hibiscus syriacus TaxID=106335 RepID=A0A6A2WV38_HIBSY|nr:hypothetical protein F3Y22_tig00112737pilonHSYRG00040 [Hibiscus syriacus]